MIAKECLDQKLKLKNIMSIWFQNVSFEKFTATKAQAVFALKGKQIFGKESK